MIALGTPITTVQPDDGRSAEAVKHPDALEVDALRSTLRGIPHRLPQTGVRVSTDKLFRGTSSGNHDLIAVVNSPNPLRGKVLLREYSGKAIGGEVHRNVIDNSTVADYTARVR